MYFYTLLLVYLSMRSTVGKGYIGCFQDGPKRILSGANIMPHSDPKTMTPQLCISFCKSKSYRFAGVQYNYQCFCGNDYSGGVKKPEAECSLKCSGDSNQKCGGHWRMNIYKSEPFPEGYIGCFQDGPKRILSGSKIMPHSDPKTMTPQLCISYCKSKSYRFAGVQYSFECFCGDDYSGGVKKSEAECGFKCSGDSKQKCGGNWRMNIYKSEPFPEGYIGCFKDEHQRILSGANIMPHSDPKTMTPRLCRSFCKSKKHKFAGVQYSFQCFCGDDFSRGVKQPEAECSSKCSGDIQQTCGGGWRMNIYRSGLDV